MEVIPAVDVRAGQCVRLEQGRADRQTVYDADPAAAALRWQEQGARRLHLVDLDGAFSGRPANAAAIRKVLAAVSVPAEVGGGVRDAGAARGYLEAGARWVVVGTRAARDPQSVRELAAELPGRLLLGLDCRQGRVQVSGWTESAGSAPEELLALLAGAPFAAAIYTNVARDGMLSGPDFEGLERLRAASPWPLIASGGVSSAEHVRRLAGMGLAGCIIGQALYRGVLTLPAALAAAEAG